MHVVVIVSLVVGWTVVIVIVVGVVETVELSLSCTWPVSLIFKKKYVVTGERRYTVLLTVFFAHQRISAASM